MSALQLNDMIVGQLVAYTNNYNSEFDIFKVMKITKLKIYFIAVYTNKPDFYEEEMEFNIKSGRRLNVTWNEHSEGRFFSVEEAQQRLDAENKMKKRKKLFKELHIAAYHENLTLVNEIVKQLNRE